MLEMTLPLQWWSKKLTLPFLGILRVQKPRISWLYYGSTFFQPVSTHQTHQTCRKDAFRFFATSHQISSQHFYRKVLFLNKIKMSTRWPSSFQALFLAITSQPHRLVAFPRSAKLQNSSLNISSHSGHLQRQCGVLWTPNCDLEVNFPNLRIWTLTPPQKNGSNWHFSKGSCFRLFRRSARRKKRIGSLDVVAGYVFLFYAKFCYNFSTPNAQIWIFLKTLKCKGMFFSFSFDSLLPRWYRDEVVDF